MATQVDKALALATDIAEMRRLLLNKEAEFAKLMGAKSPGLRAAASFSSGTSDVPIAQRVLQIAASGPKTRGEIIEAVGGHDAAVTSALKKHKATGKLKHADGKYSTAGTSTATPVQVRKGTASK